MHDWSPVCLPLRRSSTHDDALCGGGQVHVCWCMCAAAVHCCFEDAASLADAIHAFVHFDSDHCRSDGGSDRGLLCASGWHLVLCRLWRLAWFESDHPSRPFVISISIARRGRYTSLSSRPLPKVRGRVNGYATTWKVPPNLHQGRFAGDGQAQCWPQGCAHDGWGMFQVTHRPTPPPDSPKVSHRPAVNPPSPPDFPNNTQIPRLFP